jgi:ABC-type uncharacterized transport system ATPase subunit
MGRWNITKPVLINTGKILRRLRNKMKVIKDAIYETGAWKIVYHREDNISNYWTIQAKTTGIKEFSVKNDVMQELIEIVKEMEL